MTTTTSFSGTLFEWKHSWTQFFNLRENNDALQEENAKLRSEADQSLIRMQHGYVKVNDTLHKVQYEYVPAKVINSSYTRRNNYFTIDIGTDQGIKHNMGVFSSNGVIGVIHYANDQYSIVKSCLTEKVDIAVMVESTREQGFLKWDGKDAKRGTITGISNDSKVEKWSKVVTKGSAGIFPEGIPVGKVEKSVVVEGKPLWDVTVLFSENYRTVQRVYVVKNLLKDKQDEAESHIPQDVAPL